MGFFDFNQEDILPYSESNVAKRNSRVSNNMANLREEMNMIKEYEASSNKIKKEMALEETAKGLVNSSAIERRKRNHEEGVLKESLMRQTLVTYLTETTLKGLVFDRDFYYAQEMYLREELNNFFNKSFNEGVISNKSFSSSDNMLLEDLYNHFERKVNNLVENRTETDVFNEDTVLEMLQEDDFADKISDEIAKIVREKVMDTLEKEKKISIKKDSEKEEMDKAVAADSLDKDVQDDNAEQADDEEVEDYENDEDPDDDELEADENEADDEDFEDEEEDIDTDDDEDEDDDEIDSDDEDEDDDEDHEDLSNELDSHMEEDSEGKKDSITITANGVNITVSANKSESIEYLNLFGSGRFKERNSKTLFRNLMENVLKSSVSSLTESSSPEKSSINMDFVLAETVVQYTILETLYTSKIINPSNNQIENFKKSMNFR